MSLSGSERCKVGAAPALDVAERVRLMRDGLITVAAASYRKLRSRLFPPTDAGSPTPTRRLKGVLGRVPVLANAYRQVRFLAHVAYVGRWVDLQERMDLAHLDASGILKPQARNSGRIVFSQQSSISSAWTDGVTFSRWVAPKGSSLCNWPGGAAL